MTTELSEKIQNCIAAIDSLNPHNEHDVTKIDEYLKQVLILGDDAVEAISDYLWENLELSGNRLILKNVEESDIDTEWLRKERVIIALSKTNSQLAFCALAPMLLVHEADQIFNDKIIKSVEKGVVNIKGERTLEALKELEHFDVHAMHPMTIEELDTEMSAFMYGDAKQEIFKEMEPKRTCVYCGAELDEDADFCMNCGMPAVEPEKVFEFQQIPKVQPKMFISKAKYTGLMIWTIVSMLFGAMMPFIISIIAMWQLWRLPACTTEEESKKCVKLVIILNICADILSVISWVYLIGTMQSWF